MNILLNNLQHQLTDYLAAQPGVYTDVKVEDFRKVGGRWMTGVYAFRLSYVEAGQRSVQRLVLKTYANDAEGIDRAMKERHALFNLRAARYPTPGVMLVEIDPQPLGRPFVIMEYVEGTALADLLKAADPAQRHALIAQFVGLLVDLHERGPQVLVKTLSAMTPLALINREIHVMRGLADKRRQAEFLPVIDWLYANRDRVPCTQPVVTHRNYHPWNVLMTPAGVPYVIDWAWQISDARFDVASTLQSLEREGLGDLRDDVLAEYERVTGGPVAELAYFEVVAAVRWLMSVSHEARQRLNSDKAGHSPFMLSMREPAAAATALIAAVTGINLPDADALLM
ncbi:MAG: Phosphotransferase enzyme family protein [Chloroflexi bacterium OLB13]|nr:MAG: Phosphotransferase enzyme family protein [Chloroflexi bacterium OLB13]OQY80422.1 MAG: hypothetical protein B6D42_13115 [Anaerolineae bacterium UTCFX5]